MTHQFNDPQRPRLSRTFYRAHGLGNDYLVAEAGDDWLAQPRAVEAVCHRTEGVGSDGLVTLLTDSEPFQLRMFNPDGGEFERSGNGLRILGSWLHRTGRVAEAPFRIRTGGDEVRMQVHSVDDQGLYDISVEMGRAGVGSAAVALDPTAVDASGNRGLDGATAFALPDGSAALLTPISIGNPHAVVWGAPEMFGAVREADMLRIGAMLATHPAFANGINVQIARVIDAATVEILIWERGVGPTSASGTSSCAVAVAAVVTGQVPPGEIRITMPGGEMRVTVSAELDVILRGPVQAVGQGEIDPGFLAGLA